VIAIIAILAGMLLPHCPREEKIQADVLFEQSPTNGARTFITTDDNNDRCRRR